MTQEIRIEVDEHSFTVKELKAIRKLAKKYPHQNIRVTDDVTNIKIYVGEYYLEPYRYWTTPDGDIALVERDDARDSDDEAIWESVGLQEAYDHLSLPNL